jgi:hypothetical protein
VERHQHAVVAPSQAQERGEVLTGSIMGMNHIDLPLLTEAIETSDRAEVENGSAGRDLNRSDDTLQFVRGTAKLLQAAEVETDMLRL